ncbi:DUF397 domain-containing protein [Lentzea sp. NPDC004782]|uniref:DUF397 domain-containing protein n=1 Tax=Lentzea sp. NPDC004782 TaxID=3154458 RepID=UPI0033B33BCD
MPVARCETDLTRVFVQDRGAIARTRRLLDCVEVSLTRDARVRDSKNVAGEVLTFSTSAWRAS